MKLSTIASVIVVLGLGTSSVACMQSDVGDQQPVADGGAPQDTAPPPVDNGPQPVICGERLINCSGVCRDLTRDGANCGGCGLTCNAGQSCVNSACVPNQQPQSCTGGLTSCNNVCCNLQTDTNNCGACGRTCAAGQTCNAGTCTDPRPACGGANLATDSSNCGTCGTRCGSGESCMGGMCVGASEDTYEVTASAPRNVDSIDINDYWNGSHGVANYLDPGRGGVLTSHTHTFRVPRGQYVALNALFTFPASSGLRAVFSCGVPSTGASFTRYGEFIVRRNGSMVVMTNAMTNNRMGCNWVPVDRMLPST